MFSKCSDLWWDKGINIYDSFKNALWMSDSWQNVLVCIWTSLEFEQQEK